MTPNEQHLSDALDLASADVARLRAELAAVRKAAEGMRACLLASDVELAHDAASDIAEDEDGSNDAERDALVALLETLCDFWQKRDAALAAYDATREEA